MVVVYNVGYPLAMIDPQYAMFVHSKVGYRDETTNAKDLKDFTILPFIMKSKQIPIIRLRRIL